MDATQFKKDAQFVFLRTPKQQRLEFIKALPDKDVWQHFNVAAKNLKRQMIDEYLSINYEAHEMFKTFYGLNKKMSNKQLAQYIDALKQEIGYRPY